MKNNDEILNKTFFKKYKIIKRIGKGSFGLVYLGKNITSNNFVAVKFESKNQRDIILERESYFLYYLRGFGIPEVITFGYNSKYNILVQTLLGNTINEIFLHNNKKFSMKDCCMIGIQMLDRLEYIHSKYIIHRDIKPDNYLIGRNDKSVIYLIDFGLAKKYMSSRTGKHVKFAIKKKWSGTSRFASVNSLRGVVQSRRDDLESLCYVLLFIMKGSLPWDNVFGYSENDDILLIYKIKRFMKPELLFFNLPKETIEFYKYCKNLDFEQKPDYNYLRSLLLNILFYNNQKNDLNFSWINNKIKRSTQKDISNNYIKLYKRKNSPQQKIYNSLNSFVNNKIKVAKRSESYNEFLFNLPINKVKTDWRPIKNVSPSPNQNKFLFKNDKKEIEKEKEKEKEKYNYIKKIPNGKKKITIDINNMVKKNMLRENIIVKTPTETERLKIPKKLNIIPLTNFTYNNYLNESFNTKQIKPALKNCSFNNINILKEKDIYNKIIIKKNYSYNGKDTRKLCINNIKKNNKLTKKFNNKIYLKNIFNLKNQSNSFDNKLYDITNKKNNLLLNNYIPNYTNNDLNINLIQNNNNDNINKKYSGNISLNTNKIYFQNNIKYSHLSPKEGNKYKRHNEEPIKKNVPNFIHFKSNQIKLNLGRKILSFYDKDKNTIKYINTEKYNYKPQKSIKIINIISPINKTSTYYQARNNSLSFREKQFDDININNNYIINQTKTKHSFNSKKFEKNYKNGFLTECNNNKVSLYNKCPRPNLRINTNNNSKLGIINENIVNQNKIIRSSSNYNYYFKNRQNTYDNNNINNYNLKRNIIAKSLSYVSPVSIIQYKNNN